MTKPVSLPLALVLEKGREAFLVGRLSAQGPSPQCAYRDESGLPCVIGAALTDDEAALLSSRKLTNIQSLIDDGLVVTRARRALPRLQQLHDVWASHESDYLLSVELDYARSRQRDARKKADRARARLMRALGVRQ